MIASHMVPKFKVVYDRLRARELERKKEMFRELRMGAKLNISEGPLFGPSIGRGGALQRARRAGWAPHVCEYLGLERETKVEPASGKVPSSKKHYFRPSIDAAEWPAGDLVRDW